MNGLTNGRFLPMLGRPMAAGMLLLALAACSQTADIPGIQKKLEAEFLEDIGVKASVDCPDVVEWDEGKTFRCDVDWEDGDQGEVEITMMEDGDYTYEYPAP